MPDFTGTSHPPVPHNRRSTGDAAMDDRIRQLVADWGCINSCESVEQMIVTALKMGRDDMSGADLKLINRSLGELRHAARMFAGYRDRKKCAVFGSARTHPERAEFKAAQEFGRRMVEEGYMIITGAGDGIMGAAQKGAGRENSFGLNIRLPFEQRSNETIHGDRKLITFNYFFTRKLNFVKETHAIALFPGGFGTMDEGFEVLTLMQTGKGRIIPMVFVDVPGGLYWKTWTQFLKEHLLHHGLVSPEDFSFFKVTESLDEAVAEIRNFYRVFHSYRWVGDRMVIRLNRWLSDPALKALRRDFQSALERGTFELCAALPEEAAERELAKLPRLVFAPERRNYARIRQLIDAINLSEVL